MTESIPTEGSGTEIPAVPPVAPTTQSTSVTPPTGKRSNTLLISLLVIALLIAGGYFLLKPKTSALDLAKIQGKIALSEGELRDVVKANHLTVYWAGPLAGAKYALVATNPNLIYLKYLPGGVGINDNTTAFRTVGTYVQKNAYAVGMYTGTVAGNVGMTNPDGNSVFYSSSRGTNIYVGIKGKDIQVEVYDPVAGTALGLVLTKNQIVPIS